MPDEALKPERAIAIVKDSFTVLRDCILVILFVFLVFFPVTLNQRLADAGFTEGSVAGFKWQKQIKAAEEKTKNAAQMVSQLPEQFVKLGQNLETLGSQTSDAKLKASISELVQEVKQWEGGAKSANSDLSASLISQQQIVDQLAPGKIETSGWLYLGKVTEDKKQWIGSAPENVYPVPAEIAPGTTLKTRRNTYLHADGPAGKRKSAPVLAGIKDGQSVEVTDPPDYSHKEGGGWFVWAKVKRL